MIMDSPQRQKIERAYREAFEEFSRNVRHVQSLIGSSRVDAAAAEAALLELQKAYVAYDRARDAWGKVLLGSASQTVVPISSRGTGELEASAVRSIAELLWESAGRPEGTASEDWRRAEEIVRKAAAAA